MLAEDQIRKDVKDLTNQVQRLEEKADIGADSMGEIKYGLKSVLVLLQGNELNKNDAGMIGDITDALNRIRKLENFKDRALYIPDRRVRVRRRAARVLHLAMVT